MLISNCSKASKISNSFINEFSDAQSRMRFGITPSPRQHIQFESLMMNFVKIFVSSHNIERELNNAWKYITSMTSGANDFFLVIHTILINPQFDIVLKSNALFALSKMMKKNGPKVYIGFFKQQKISNFYADLLFKCNNENDIISLSAINSLLFDVFESHRQYLIDMGLLQYVLDVDGELISALIVSVSRSMPQMPQEYIEIFVQRVVSLISSKNNNTSLDAMESLISLMRSGVQILIKDIESFEKDLNHNLFTEEEGCISNALEILTMFNIPPVKHFDIFSLITCRYRRLGVAAIRCIRHFTSDIINSSDCESIKMSLFSVVDDQPFHIVYECILTLLNYPLVLEEKKVILQKLIIFLDDEDLQEECLSLIQQFLQNSEPNEIKSLIDIIKDDDSLFDDLSWSENQNVAHAAQAILSLVDSYPNT